MNDIYPCKTCGCDTCDGADQCFSCWCQSVEENGCVNCGTQPAGETGECRWCHVHGSKYGVERARRQRLLDEAIARQAR